MEESNPRPFTPAAEFVAITPPRPLNLCLFIAIPIFKDTCTYITKFFENIVSFLLSFFICLLFLNIQIYVGFVN